RFSRDWSSDVCSSDLGGAESMSYIPMGGYKPIPDTDVAKNNADYYWGMGLTAEAVANEFKVSREDQDRFAFNSHQKAVKALETRSEERRVGKQSRTES